MQVGNVTTPFGRRPITLALVKNQLTAADVRPGKSVDKWKVFRDACEARAILGVADRALSVLNALLSFYPEQHLCEGQSLIVFPSNNQLSIRAHGITGTTLRRHIAVLVDAGLILRKDSPNGKRYAHKDNSGSIEDAFGFSLAPLLARAEELAHLAQQVAFDRKALRLAKERLSLCRRDVRKLVTAALEEGATGDWQAIEDAYVELVARIPRAPSITQFRFLADELDVLRNKVINMLEMQAKTEKSDGNDIHIDHHIHNSNTDLLNESDGTTKRKKEEETRRIMQKPDGSIKAYPLSIVLKACPDIAMYGPDGTVGSWRDLMSAAVVVRSMLGVSPSAYQNACDIMGPENAATALACILERGGHINSAGGYLRDLTRRAENGEFSIGPMLMALLRNNGSATLKTG